MFTKRFLPVLVIALLLSVLQLSVSQVLPAAADSPSNTYTFPSGVVPSIVYAHGNGMHTVADSNCQYSYTSVSANYSSMTLDGSTMVSDTPKTQSVDSVGWQTQPCPYSFVAGVDGASYVVQTTASPAKFRILATREQMDLWAAVLEDPDPNCNRLGRIYSLTLGDNGNLYAISEWLATGGSCILKEALVEIDPGTGATNWFTVLPETGASGHTHNKRQLVPYNNGLAVLNGTSVYHYDYDGAQQTGTFSPTLNGALIHEFQVVLDTGRVFLLTQKYDLGTYTYKLYYKDLSSYTITEISLSSATGIGNIFATPTNGVVAYWNNGSNRYFSYFDSSGSQVYQQYLNTETGSVFSTNGLGFTVDDDGNVIVRRQFDVIGSYQDRNVIIDSFSPTGTMTRLFNSATSLATSGLDSFTSTSRMINNIGDGKLYVILCHKTGSYTTSCSGSYNPKVLAIDLTSSTDYPRSHIFANELSNSVLNYVALGDSFSSGEGVPIFIPPSDTGSNDCHRSYDAYPVLMHWTNAALRLRAFRACSGASSYDVKVGKHGEPGQLDSLNDDTDIVTITVGGNDINFGDFAMECGNPFGECTWGSQPFLNAIAMLNGGTVKSNLDGLFSDIHTNAPNAEVYIGGYPYITTTYGCYWLNDDEAETARDLVAALNLVIMDAVLDEPSGQFHYVGPMASGSPFTGHELCTQDSYFNDVYLSTSNYVYTFHPNKDGQEAYASLFADAIN